MRLCGDDGPVVRPWTPEADESHLIAKQLVLPEHAFQIVEWEGVVKPRLSIGPTDGVASQIGLGVLPPKTGRGIVAHIMLAPSVTLRRRKASRENQAACFGSDAEGCPFFFRGARSRPPHQMIHLRVGTLGGDSRHLGANLAELG